MGGQKGPMAIDNRIDKIREILDERDDDLLAGLIQVGGFEPIMAVVAAVKGVLDGEERYDRVRAALRALCDELELAWTEPHDSLLLSLMAAFQMAKTASDRRIWLATYAIWHTSAPMTFRC